MRRIAPPKDTRAYRQLWRVVDGAVASAFAAHPDYIARRESVVRNSINKRVVGAVLGYAAEAAQGRSGERPAVETETEPARVGLLARAATTLARRSKGGALLRHLFRKPPR